MAAITAGFKRAATSYVYMKRTDIRTQVTSSQSGNMTSYLCGTGGARMVSTPFICSCPRHLRHHDMARAAGTGDTSGSQRLGTRQAIFQQMRNALLYGIDGGR